MRQASRWVPGLALTTAAALALAGCAAGGTPGAGSSATPSTTASTAGTTPTPGPVGTATPEPPPPPPDGSAMTRVTVTRTGGIAGVSQSLRVEPDGSWTFTDRRPVAQKSGRLTESELRRLAELVTAAALAREARMAPPMGTCNDAFVYVVNVGEISARFDDCANANDRPTTAAIIELLVEATPL